MGEDISRLVDGEISDAELDAVFAKLKQGKGKATWECYHVIGDTLRGGNIANPGFSQRFAARLAEEPTVLAPQRSVRRAAARHPIYAWAAAAGVAAVALVGWVTFITPQPPSAAIARAGDNGAVRPIAPTGRTIPADFLLAHQQVTPTAATAAAAAASAPGSHLRSVAAPPGEQRP